MIAEQLVPLAGRSAVEFFLDQLSELLLATARGDPLQCVQAQTSIETADPGNASKAPEENPNCETRRVCYSDSGHIHRVGPADNGARLSLRTEALDGADAER